MLKIFIYGYLNRIRSSRALEKECKRNIELMWLVKCLSPDHNTISNFRRDNPKAIKKVYRATVNIAKNLDLIGGILIAGDGTKLRAQNLHKGFINNYKKKNNNYLPRTLISIKENSTSEKSEVLPTSTQHNVPAWTVFAIFFIVIPLSTNFIYDKTKRNFFATKNNTNSLYISYSRKNFSFYTYVYCSGFYNFVSW